MKALQTAGWSVLATTMVFGQAPPQRLEFEVASIRPAAPLTPQTAVVGLRLDGAQARIGAMTMKDYVAMAYRVKAYQVTGPDWISTERWDLNAKLPDGATASQIPEMVQSLLSDRFQMKVHRDQKDFPVYALIPGKTPLKLKESPLDSAAGEARGAFSAVGSGSAAGVSVNLGNGTYYTFADNKFEIRKMSMAVLAGTLERYVDRPIIDMTGLAGTYDLTLNLTPEDYQAMLIRAAVSSGVVLPPQALRLMDGNSSASLLDALQQVGLKLDARKAPLDLVVIDQIQKTPTEN